MALALLVLAVGAGLASANAHGASRSTARSLTFYTSVGDGQFVDNRDDRQRGLGKNPFGNITSKPESTTQERVKGPLPGDSGLFSYAIYSSPSSKASVGSATLSCVYTFARTGTCEASYALAGGTVTGIGVAPAVVSTSISLNVTGGTGEYAGATGSIELRKFHSLALLAHEKVTVNGPSLVVQPQRVSLQLTVPAAQPLKRLTAYSVGTAETYINNTDDEARGWTTNPFGLRDARVRAAQKGTGPFAGDAALFKVALYADATLKKPVGSGFINCQYTFDRNALCDVSYTINGATIVGLTSVPFTASSFPLVLTGGSGAFAGLRGNAIETKGKKSERLQFVLQSA